MIRNEHVSPYNEAPIGRKSYVVYLRGQFGTSDLPKLKRMTSKHLIIIIIITIINREILDPILSIQVRAYSSRKLWRLQFHNSKLYFRTRPPNLCSHRRCERNFVLIPTHFYHATTLQLCAFARHSAS